MDECGRRRYGASCGYCHRTFVVGIGLMYDNRSTQEKVEYLPEQETCESARLAVHS